MDERKKTINGSSSTSHWCWYSCTPALWRHQISANSDLVVADRDQSWPKKYISRLWFPITIVLLRIPRTNNSELLDPNNNLSTLLFLNTLHNSSFITNLSLCRTSCTKSRMLWLVITTRTRSTTLMTPRRLTRWMVRYTTSQPQEHDANNSTHRFPRYLRIVS